MKVVRDMGNIVDFVSLNVGDCFGHSGCAYIKTVKQERNSPAVTHNCVRLSDGRYGTFSHDTRVTAYHNAHVTLD